MGAFTGALRHFRGLLVAMYLGPNSAVRRSPYASGHFAAQRGTRVPARKQSAHAQIKRP